MTMVTCSKRTNKPCLIIIPLQSMSGLNTNIVVEPTTILTSDPNSVVIWIINTIGTRIIIMILIFFLFIIAVLMIGNQDTYHCFCPRYISLETSISWKNNHLFWTLMWLFFSWIISFAFSPLFPATTYFNTWLWK